MQTDIEQSKNLVIRSAKDAENALKTLQDMPTDKTPIVISFEGWPVNVVTLQGHIFDGGMPTSMLPSISKLQSTLRKEYAYHLYGDETFPLTAQDRRNTEFVIYIDRGSSVYKSLLDGPLTVIASKMNGNQALAGIVVMGLTLAGLVGIPSYLNLERTKAENAHFERMAQIGNEADQKQQEIFIERLIKPLVNAIANDHHISFGENNEESIDGRQAKKIVAERSSSVDTKASVHEILQGNFRIRAIAESKSHNGEYVTFIHEDTKEVYARVRVVESQISMEQRQLYYDALRDHTLIEAIITFDRKSDDKTTNVKLIPSSLQGTTSP